MYNLSRSITPVGGIVPPNPDPRHFPVDNWRRYLNNNIERRITVAGINPDKDLNMENYYSEENIENYVLLGYKPKKGIPLDKNLLLSGHKSSSASLVLFVLSNYFIFHDGAGSRYISWLNYNIIFLALISIVIILAIKVNQSSLKYQVKKNVKVEKFRVGKSALYIAAPVGTAGTVAIGRDFARAFSYNYPDRAGIMGSIAVGLLVLGFTFLACIDYHKVYLIRKFCPHLKKRVGY